MKTEIKWIFITEVFKLQHSGDDLLYLNKANIREQFPKQFYPDHWDKVLTVGRRLQGLLNEGRRR